MRHIIAAHSLYALKHSHFISAQLLPSGMNFLVGLGFGGVLALRLSRIFTKHSVAGIILVALPGKGGPEDRLIVTALRYLPSCALRCFWKSIKRNSVLRRYGSQSIGDLEVVAALRRADSIQPKDFLYILRWFSSSIRSSSSSSFSSVYPSSFELGDFRSYSLAKVIAIHGEAQLADAAIVAKKLGLKQDERCIVRGSRSDGNDKRLSISNNNHQTVGGFGVAEERPFEIADVVLRLISDEHDRRTKLGLVRVSGLHTEGSQISRDTRSVVPDRVVDDPDDYATF